MIKFLIWSNQHGAWWAPGGRGYTLDINRAGRFAKHQAEREVEGAGAYGPHGVPDEVMVLAPEYRWEPGPLLELGGRGPTYAHDAHCNVIHEAGAEPCPPHCDDAQHISGRPCPACGSHVVDLRTGRLASD